MNKNIPKGRLIIGGDGRFVAASASVNIDITEDMNGIITKIAGADALKQMQDFIREAGDQYQQRN